MGEKLVNSLADSIASGSEILSGMFVSLLAETIQIKLIDGLNGIMYM